MISVVIPTYKNPQYLDLCLHSLYETQTYENEVIIVVDGEIEISREVLDKYPNTKVLDLGVNRGINVATNWGVYNATNEFVLIVNDDNVFPKNWDTVLVGYQKRGEVITPNMIEPNPSMFRQLVIKNLGQDIESFNLDEFWDYESTIPSKNFNKEGSTFPLMMSKFDYISVGGLDIMYPSNHVSDWDLFLKCEYVGFKMIRIYDIHFYHFVSKATRKTKEMDQEATRKEIEAHKFFKLKWGQNAEHNPLDNSKMLRIFQQK